MEKTLSDKNEPKYRYEGVLVVWTPDDDVSSFQLATAPGFQVNQIPKGHLVFFLHGKARVFFCSTSQGNKMKPFITDRTGA